MALFNSIANLFKPEAPFGRVFPPLWLALFVILIGVDLVSKKVATDSLNFNLSYDQAVKMQLKQMPPAVTDGTEKVDLLGDNGNLAMFRLVFNDRFVFGSGPSAPILGFFMTLGAVIFLFLYRWHHPELGHHYAWLLVFSGALGNLIDKMFVKSVLDRSWEFFFLRPENHVSGVVDFIELIWFGWDKAGSLCLGPFCPLGFLSWPRWPTFNIADSFIVVGISLLVLTMKELDD